MEENAKKKPNVFTNLIKKVGDTFKALKAEFKKIIWPNKESFTKQTIAVVLTSVFLGALIAVLDLVIKFGINFLI